MIISANKITKKYSGHTALNNITVDIPKNCIFGLLGPNGAGKTTFIRIITKIINPDTGSILFDGKEISYEDIRKIGYLPEERGLYKKMTVAEQLLYFARLKGLSTKEANLRVNNWIKKLQLSSWANKKTEELSKGMQQKVQFIAAVIHAPQLLILDEPFTGFDPINAQIIIEEIKNLQKEGTTIVFSTHRMESVELLCDSICLINNAQIIIDGKVEDIKKKFSKPEFVVSYSGKLENDDIFESIQHSNGKFNTDVILLKKDIPNNELIKHLMQKIEIISFSEKLPTMEEIFIQAVQNSNQK